jgi:hypothetical protein
MDICKNHAELSLSISNVYSQEDVNADVDMNARITRTELPYILLKPEVWFGQPNVVCARVLQQAGGVASCLVIA